MALIKCPECSKEVSDKAASCPNCGYVVNAYLNKYNKNKKFSFYSYKKKILLFGVISIIVGIIICALIGIKHRNDKKKMENFLYNYSYSSSSNSSSNKSGKDSSSIFRNLDISDFSTSKSKHWYNASCKVKNNNAFTVKGYFRANFYDQDGELLYNQLMSLPDVGTGESVVCSTMISLDNYPVDYDYVEFTQETLVESD